MIEERVLCRFRQCLLISDCSSHDCLLEEKCHVYNKPYMAISSIAIAHCTVKRQLCTVISNFDNIIMFRLENAFIISVVFVE